MNSWVTNEKKATRMNNDIITQKHFNIQAVIKWKIRWFFNLDIWNNKKTTFFYLLISYPSTNCSICVWPFLRKFKCTFTHLSISSFRLFAYPFPLLIFYVYSMINHCAYIQTNKAFSCTHTHDWTDHSLISSIVSCKYWI